jgi:uncharacterized protein (TIGR00661 family)
MKILYAIQGTGNGHLSRALEIIPILQQQGEVGILISGNQSQVELPFEVNYRFHGLSFVASKSGGISFFKTLMNIKLFRLINEIRKLKVERYNLVISDFEPISAWACAIRNVKCVQLSHQAAVMLKESPKPDIKYRFGNYVLNHYCPSTVKYGFHFEKYAEAIFSPVIRKQVRELEASDQGHYVVYLPAYHDEVLYQFLWNFSARWVVFSKYTTTKYTKDNVTFLPVDNEVFLNELASCKGVLTGAGFELPSEAMFLNKKLMVIPMENQFEQQCNAESLKRMGVTVLPKLDLINYRAMYNWLKFARPVKVEYSNDTEAIIEKIINEHATEFESTKESEIVPKMNWQFYRYFF